MVIQAIVKYTSHRQFKLREAYLRKDLVLTAGSLSVSDAKETEVSSLCRRHAEVTRSLPRFRRVFKLELRLRLERADFVIEVSVHLTGTRDCRLEACVATGASSKLGEVRARLVFVALQARVHGALGRWAVVASEADLLEEELLHAWFEALVSRVLRIVAPHLAASSGHAHLGVALQHQRL